MNDVLINKSETILRCLNRIREEYQNNPERLTQFVIQDSIILNLQRACEAAIDLSMHLVAKNKWEIPQESRQAFETLLKQKVISAKIAHSMSAMVGFRNIAVHDYQAIELPILQSILEKHLVDFEQYLSEVKHWSH